MVVMVAEEEEGGEGERGDDEEGEEEEWPSMALFMSVRLCRAARGPELLPGRRENLVYVEKL